MAIMQFLMSPGGKTCSSSRSRPELPPSSVTVTMTDKRALIFFNPRNRVERPVPPPIETILGSLLFFVANALFFRRRHQLLEVGILLQRLEVAVARGEKTILWPIVDGLFQITDRGVGIAMECIRSSQGVQHMVG